MKLRAPLIKGLLKAVLLGRVIGRDYGRARAAASAMVSVLFAPSMLAMLSVLSVGAVPLFASPSPAAYQPYTPMREDGYVQAWNLTFVGQGYDLQVMFLVSNVGPGDQNHGSALLIYHDGRSQSFTSEHTAQTLQATPGQFGLNSAGNVLRMGDGAVEAKADFNGARVHLQIQPTVEGALFPDWKLTGTDFFRIGVPVLQGRATADLEWQGKRVRLEGRGLVDSVLSNVLPQKYAKRLFLFRGYGRDALLATGFQDLNGHVQMRIFKRVQHEWQVESSVMVEDSGVETDPFSLYRISRSTTLHSGPCRYEVRRQEFRGGMFVLQSVTPFLRWVLQTFFAKPFILNYDGVTRAECDPLPAVPGRARLTYFLLKE